MTKAVMIDVMRKYKGELSHTPWSVELKKDHSISIFDTGALCNTFAIGDRAEYDSYNLSYIGVIRGISRGRITIVAYEGTQMERHHWLSLYQFCQRNHGFVLDEVLKINQDAMMNI